MDFRCRVERRLAGMALPLVLGASRVGALAVDLAEQPHVLVGGSTGSGKSVLLRQLLVGQVARLDPSELRLVLVDMKGGMEFNTFEGLPHLMCDPVSEVEDAEIELGRVVQELERRQGLMSGARVKSLREWNAKFPGDRLPYVVVVVDEFAEFRAADAPEKSDERKGRQAVVARLGQVGRLGRAVGIHLIACTQRPDAETITPQLRAQFPGKVAFYVTDAMNSRVILDDPAAAALPPPWLTRGRAVWKGESAQMVEFQVPYLSDEQAVRLLTPRYAAAAATVVEPDFGAGPEAADDQSEEAA
jgi:S-DNA-T family DNA segregation ATPase FtsK/SpoIIIE